MTKKSKWDLQSCKSEALKYLTKNQFERGSPGAFKKAYREGWLPLICSHMTNPHKPKGYWTYDRCKEEAAKYKTRKDFFKNSGSAHNAAQKNKWLEEICSHMPRAQMKAGTWDSKVKCLKEALKYQTIKEFRENTLGAYLSAVRNKWIGEIKSNFINKKSPYKWTKEKCKTEALKYKSRSEFNRAHPNAYRAVLRWKWNEDVFAHMLEMGNSEKKRLYKISFKDGAHYVGYSVNVEERILSHLRGSSNKFVADRIGRGKIACIHIEYLWLTANEADKLEIETIVELKKSIGDLCLNILSGGQRGSSEKFWTEDRCREEALKYSKRTEFAKKGRGAYQVALDLGIMDQICQHMPTTKNWSVKESCHDEALRFDNRTSFQKASPGAYESAYKHKWLVEICSHMVKLKNTKGTWENFEACRTEALKYKTRNDFSKKSRGAYKSSLLYGWLDIICDHMTSRQVKEGTWAIKENCAKEAKKYLVVSHFSKKSSGAYKAAKKFGWLEEICIHMKPGKLPNRYWDKDKCKLEAQKYKSKSAFQKGSGSAYNSSVNNGWLDEVCSHMKNKK